MENCCGPRAVAGSQRFAIETVLEDSGALRVVHPLRLGTRRGL